MLEDSSILAHQVMDHSLASAKADDRVFHVTLRLVKRAQRALPVLDDSGRLEGIITERDCLRALVRAVHHKLPPSLVRDVMTRDVITVPHDASLMAVVHTFHDHPVSVLPVVEGDRCVGLISRDRCLARAAEVFDTAPSRDAAILYISALGRISPL